MPLAKGAVFGGYTIVQVLGSGAMGEVYLLSIPATVWVDGRRRRAHRIAYEQATGEQLGDLVVVAKCRNSLCLNLSYLTAATKKQVQNRRDRPNRNNRNSGVRNVYRDRDRWRAQITADGVAIHIGTFHCIEDADAAVRTARACIAA